MAQRLKNGSLNKFLVPNMLILILSIWTTCNARMIGNGNQDASKHSPRASEINIPLDQLKLISNNENRLTDKRFLGYSIKSSIGKRTVTSLDEDSSSSRMRRYSGFDRENRFLGYPSQRSYPSYELNGLGKRFLGAGNIKRFRLIPDRWEGKRVPSTNDFLGKRALLNLANDQQSEDDGTSYQGLVPSSARMGQYPQYFNGGSDYYKRDGFGRNVRLQTNDFLG